MTLNFWIFTSFAERRQISFVIVIGFLPYLLCLCCFVHVQKGRSLGLLIIVSLISFIFSPASKALQITPRYWYVHKKHHQQHWKFWNIFKANTLKSPPSAFGSHSSKSSPLSALPYGVLLRSYLVAALSSSSMLLSFVLRLVSGLASSKSVFLSPDRNLLLRYLLKKTFHAHFCAGDSPKEVRLLVAELTQLGFSGVILPYAKEISRNRNRMQELTINCSNDPDVRSEVEMWKEGALETIRLTGEGDLIALK